MEYVQPIIDGVLDGDEEAVEAAVHLALEAGHAPLDIINQGLIPGIEQVGVLYQEGEYYLPELLTGARAMQEGMALLKPLIANFNSYSLGTVVIGTVQGDLHDIGKTLVAVMLESAGFTVIDLGADVSPQAFVDALQQHHADILAMSALLSSTMMAMKTVLDLVDASGLRQGLKVMVGGAPVSQGFAQQIGADGFGSNAGAAVIKAKELMGI